MIRFSKKKVILAGGIVIALIIITSSVVTYNNIQKKGVVNILNDIYLSYIESDGYREGFEETKYKNYTILHNENLQPGIPLIKAYVDTLEERSNDILGWVPSEELTIQLDYDEKVFNSRYNSLDESAIIDRGGYFHIASNTIYMYVDDVYRDILLNMLQVEFIDGEMYMSSVTFKDVLFHEYGHYMYNNFLKENDIDINGMPMWFEEGMAEYIAQAQGFDDGPLDFISFDKLNSNEEWKYNIINMNQNNANIYTQSYYAIYTIVNQNGESILREIILANKDMEFEKAFEQVMKISLEEFENDIKEEYHNYAKMYHENMKIDDSQYDEIKMACLEEYIKANEDNTGAYNILAGFYMKYESFDKAEALLKDGINKNPESSVLWRSLGNIYEDNDMPDLAKECFEKEEELIDN